MINNSFLYCMGTAYIIAHVWKYIGLTVLYFIIEAYWSPVCVNLKPITIFTCDQTCRTCVCMRLHSDRA